MAMQFKVEKAAEVPSHILVRNVAREFDWSDCHEVGNNIYIPADYWLTRKGIAAEVLKADEKLMKANPKEFAVKVADRMKGSFASFRAAEPAKGGNKTVGCDHEFTPDGKSYKGTRVWVTAKAELTEAQKKAMEDRKAKRAAEKPATTTKPAATKPAAETGTPKK